jgi:hypothetical protein
LLSGISTCNRTVAREFANNPCLMGAALPLVIVAESCSLQLLAWLPAKHLSGAR